MVWLALVGWFRSRASLEAEILILRQKSIFRDIDSVAERKSCLSDRYLRYRLSPGRPSPPVGL